LAAHLGLAAAVQPLEERIVADEIRLGNPMEMKCVE
jgi:hypothetical protein